MAIHVHIHIRVPFHVHVHFYVQFHVHVHVHFSCASLACYAHAHYHGVGGVAGFAHAFSLRAYYVTACSMRATCSLVRGRVGGDSKPRPKQCPITSPDRPGPLVFQRATLKNWVGPVHSYQ